MNILDSKSDDYKRWKELKLANFTGDIGKLTIDIKNPHSLTKNEASKCSDIIERGNILFFRLENEFADIKDSLLKLSKQFGMDDFEILESSEKSGLTKIEVSDEDKIKSEYVPYTNKALNWHTDGYYNDVSDPILSWMLFCHSDSDIGGENRFIDHEIVYILFNEMSDSLNDLLLEQAFTIPENKNNNRKEISGYVFKLLSNKLHMRFTMREKNIIWNKKIMKSIKLLKSIILENENYQIKHKLKPNEGVISNNIIHMRTSFTNSDNKNRLLYRLRSKKRISV